MSLFGVRRGERFIRRALLLPADPPNSSGVILKPVHGMPGVGSAIHSLSDKERAAEMARWHSEGWRAELASNLPRLHRRALRLAGDRVDALRYSLVTSRRAARRFARARTLRYTSPYLHPRDCTGIEGYFDLGDDLSFPLDIYTPTALIEYVEVERLIGGLVHSGNSLLFGADAWVVADSETLDDDVVRETIERLYRDRFEFVRGHFSQREGLLPRLEIDLAWESDEDRAELELYLYEPAS